MLSLSAVAAAVVLAAYHPSAVPSLLQANPQFQPQVDIRAPLKPGVYYASNAYGRSYAELRAMPGNAAGGLPAFLFASTDNEQGAEVVRFYKLPCRGLTLVQTMDGASAYASFIEVVSPTSFASLALYDSLAPLSGQVVYQFHFTDATASREFPLNACETLQNYRVFRDKLWQNVHTDAAR